MARYLGSGALPRGSSAFGVVIIVAVLYLAKEVLIPLALAILFSFLLAPAVRRLERWLWRVPATLLVVLLAFSLIGAVLGIAGKQALSLAAKLPEYRENITKKIHAVRAPREGDLGKAADAIKDLQQEAAPERPPVPVKETAGSPLEALTDFAAPFAKPLGTALAVIVFTILMLLNRENLRERVIGLLGSRRINLMTRAMSEASFRVSSYLSMQLVVNAMFGIPFGIALYFIGVPNAMLWGLLGMLLRFIPYAGVWVAAAMPALLAFAISDDWSMVGWTMGAFLTLELILVNAVEPWLYGRSAGLTPIAVIISAVFWTWLWGPIGLLLATPMTVCVTVIGRYVPELGYLNMLLGVEPVLSPEQRFYQRLIALDHDEAAEIAEKHTAAHGLVSTFDTVIVPALGRAEIDREKEALEPARERFIYEAVQRIVADAEAAPPKGAAHTAFCIVPAYDEADRLAGLMLARVAGLSDASVLSPPAKISEIGERIEKDQCSAIVISALPPRAAGDAGYLARRLRKNFPKLKIIIGLWAPEGEPTSQRERLQRLGVDAVVGRLADALDELQSPKAEKPAPQPT